MTLSVQTNTAAFSALQGLGRTQADLETTQARVSSGLRIAGARDGAAAFAVAQDLRAETDALDKVRIGLDRASSIVDTAVASGETISDLLNQMRAKALRAADPAVDATIRAALDLDFRALANQVRDVVANAAFDGENLIDGSRATGLAVIANAAGDRTIAVAAQDLNFDGAILTLDDTLGIGTQSAAEAALADADASIANLGQALAALAADGEKLSTHRTFVERLRDTLTNGVGQLVDADLAVEAARLQALQVRQQLGVETLSIANASPSVILNLFRN